MILSTLTVIVSCLAMPPIEISREATIYSFPLATMALKLKEQTALTPFNTFHKSSTLAAPGPSSQIPSPNADTIYVYAWFDLRNEPAVITTPDFGLDDRFYIWEFIDFETNVIDSISPRTYPNGSVLDIILKTKSQTLPLDKSLGSNTKIIESYSPIVWMVGRILVKNEKDLPKAVALQDQLKCQGLSEYLQLPSSFPVGGLEPPFPAISSSTMPNDYESFFEIVGWALRLNKGVPEENKKHFGSFQSIGLKEDGYTTSNHFKIQMEAGFKAALAEIDYNIAGLEIQPDFWATSTGVGNAGSNFLLRATVAKKYLAGNLAQDAMYFVQYVDSHYLPLNGKHQYYLDLVDPIPAKGFWSLTAYNQDHYFDENIIGKYSVGTGTDGLVLNAKGGTKILLSHTPPNSTLDYPNWLPTPSKTFTLILRAYWPQIPFTYKIPSLVRV